jgi:hydroxyacylglutathione hydrolase
MVALASLIITPLRCLKDNYAYLVHQDGAPEAFVVDPSEAEPVAAALAARGLTLAGVLATHHHPDHTGGIPALVTRKPDLVVAAHAADRGRIPHQTHFIDAPTTAWVPTPLTAAGRRLVARHIPGHTRAAIAWGLVPSDPPAAPTDVFTGDTLFAAGCGRLFEGTPAEMHASLQALTDLPEATRLWFGHEYTAANLRFAAAVEPDNVAVAARARDLAAITTPAITTPTTVALERTTNPFVRARTVAELAERRAAKDRF